MNIKLLDIEQTDEFINKYKILVDAYVITLRVEEFQNWKFQRRKVEKFYSWKVNAQKFKCFKAENFESWNGPMLWSWLKLRFFSSNVVKFQSSNVQMFIWPKVQMSKTLEVARVNIWTAPKF